MSDEFRPPKPTDHQATFMQELDALESLDILRLGSEHIVGPTTSSVCEIEELGQKSKLPDGSELSVVSRLAIPRDFNRSETVSGFDHLAVIASHAPDGRVAYAIIGLKPDAEGKMKIIMDGIARPNWVYKGGPEEAVVGRVANESAINAQNLWGRSGDYGPATSRDHIIFSLTEDNCLKIEVLGKNGTWGEFGAEETASKKAQEALGGLVLQQELGESQKKKRLEQLFEPLQEHLNVNASTDQENSDNKEIELYRTLFEGTDKEIEEYFKSHDAGSSSKEKIWPVTEQTKRDAVEVLRRVLKSPYKKYQEKLHQMGVEIDISNLPALVDKIRTDKDTRYAFGRLIMDNIEWAARIDGYLPERVQKNRGKAPRRKMSNVGDFTSREYVALICLAKLDGTFDKASLSSTDRSVLGDMNKQGQHNYAADIILGIE